MSTKYAITATVITLVGGELHEGQLYIGARRHPITYLGARRIIRKTMKNLVAITRLEQVAVA